MSLMQSSDIVGTFLDVVQEEILYVKSHKLGRQFSLSLIQSSDIAWQVSRCSTRSNFICNKSQGKGDNSVCHLCSHQTLFAKILDVLQEQILYVKSHKVREIIQFVTDTVFRHFMASL